jgi:hypothetical protein
VTRTIGAPVSTTRVPGSGVWPATEFAAYPLTGPATIQAKPASSSVPFAKTNACRRTSGTISTEGTEAATGCGGGWGAESCLFAANVIVPVPSTASRGSATKRGRSDASRPAIRVRSAETAPGLSAD